MTAELAYLGRALRLNPAAYGELFHDHCTVTRVETVVEWVKETDAITGQVNSYPVNRRQKVPVPLYWYQDAKDDRYFCTYAGYGPSMLARLRDRGIEVAVKELVDDGLGTPDLSAVRDVEWRTKQKRVFAKLLAHRRGRITCPTAFGKTFICRQLSRVYPNAEIIITVPSVDIARDIYDDLKYQMGSRVGMIGGGRNKPAQLTVVVSKSLHKAPKEVNLVLVDECHAVLTENYIKMLNRFTRARMFGFTATPEGRSDKADAFADAVFGPELVNVGYQEAVRGGNVVQLHVRLVDVPKGPDVSGSQDKVYVDRNGLWLNQTRNAVIVDQVRKAEREIGEDGQLLIMVDKTEHAYALGQLLPEFAIVTGEPDAERIKQMRRRGAMTDKQEICTPKMRDEYKKQFEAHTLKRAIATKIWSKGVDFRDLACLVRADGTASPIDSGQVPGRLSRLGRETDKEAGLLIDFFDSFSSNLAHRSRQRLKVYRTNGWKIENV